MACTCLTRRRFLAATAAGSGLALMGCNTEPPTLVSADQVDAMGRNAWSQLRAEVPESRNAEYREVLSGVSGRLLRQMGESPGDWEIRVFATPEVNAFALPSRKVGVYEGMFGVTQNPDQLAAVVGHEIGHLKANHPQERVSAEVATDMGLRVISGLLSAGEIGNADTISAALGLGAQVGLLLPYSRQQELEADAFGLGAMERAGYEGREAIALWRRMDATGGARGPEFLATHPAPASRIEAMERVLASLPA